MFTHLHVHSQYSLLGATASVEQLVQRAHAEGMTHLALTDSNALYGAVAFARACHQAEITPLIGMTVRVQPGLRSDTAYADTVEVMTLIAANSNGYRSICRLSSLIQAHPERIQRERRGLIWDDLASHTQGVIALAGGRQGQLGRLLRAGDTASAARYVSHFAGLYDDRAFLAAEVHNAADKIVAQEMEALAVRFGIPVVAVQPVYCLHAGERPLLRLLKALDLNMPLPDVPGDSLPDQGDEQVDLHWISLSEVADRFAESPHFVANVSEVVSLCRPALPDGRPIWPALALPAPQTPDESLAAQAQQGLISRFGADAADAVRQRLRDELDAIVSHGFAPLLLLVADIVSFARSRDIPVSTRGSVANSLVAYCIGITSVDPVHHDLLFERFLSPARSEAPDIDLDFCSRRRDEVLAYVRQQHGADRVALVATLSTMRPRSALREVAKAYGLDNAAITDLVKLAPRGWHPDPRRRDTTTLQEVADTLSDTERRQIVSAAAQIVGQPHHLSVHPGGIVICPGPLTDFVPVQWAPKGFLITQFDHVDVEAIGLPKIDLLGIRALTVLADTADLVRRHHDPAFKLTEIPLDDTLTGDLIACADTVGVFQCESTGAQRTLRQLQARNVADLAIANAFFKPGPATGGMAQAFIRRYRGLEAVEYLHPALEPILGRTKGVLIFQEQILRVATQVAGLSWEQADHLRRGMSKFQKQEMEAMREAFVSGCQRQQPQGPALNSRQANILWEQVAAFAGYGFNQGHATAYADVSYRSAYLKAHYPAEFLCARLAGHGGFHHPAIYMAEAVRMGIAVRPPHVNRSRSRFTLTIEPAPILWMGLGQVRDLRRVTIRNILDSRREEPFAGVRDLLARVPMQIKEARHLIACGGLDGLGESRAAMLAEVDAVEEAGNAFQLRFDFAQDATPAETPAERLRWERQLLGLPVSVQPLETVPRPAAGITRLAELLRQGGVRSTTLGYRLPGWTGGKGFFLGDGQHYVVAVVSEGQNAPTTWEPVLIKGRWLTDEWGMGWLQVEKYRQLNTA